MRERLPSIFVQNVTTVGRYNIEPCLSNAEELEAEGDGPGPETQGV